jgi:hypothetical protein
LRVFRRLGLHPGVGHRRGARSAAGPHRLPIEAHSPLEEAHALEGMARCALRAKDLEAAAARLGQALTIYQRIGAPEATRVAAQPTALTS